MKKIVITAIALSALVLSGCDNLLDKQPIDQFTDGNFWSSSLATAGLSTFLP